MTKRARRTQNAAGVILLLLPSAASSQNALPIARLDTTTIRIGQQTTLHLDVPIIANAPLPAITWPVIGDTITGKIEVVKDGGVDTTATALHRAITITSFDSGFWVVQPFRFTINGDTAETAALLLTVNTVPVDTTEAFRDIKDIYELPFSLGFWLREHWPWLAGGGVALAAGIIVLVVARRKKPTGPAPVKRPEKSLSERTLEALLEVERRKLWQQGLVKQHHSETTDILRGYIEARFHVPALERTTDELVKELSLSGMGAEHRERVTNLLRLADMVKFAKWNPSPTENEQVVQGALAIVRETTLTDAPVA